jgi:hypothetical protein
MMRQHQSQLCSCVAIDEKKKSEAPMISCQSHSPVVFIGALDDQLCSCVAIDAKKDREHP